VIILYMYSTTCPN